MNQPQASSNAVEHAHGGGLGWGSEPPRWVEVAVAVVFRRSETGIGLLVARRHDGAIRGGLWEFPGGKIEPGEVSEAAALREVEEEVGLQVVGRGPHATGGPDLVGAPRPLAVVAHTDPSVAREKSVRLHAWLVEVRPEAVARPLGSREVRWIGVAELGDFEWPPANAAINDAIRIAFQSG